MAATDAASRAGISNALSPDRSSGSKRSLTFTSTLVGWSRRGTLPPIRPRSLGRAAG